MSRRRPALLLFAFLFAAACAGSPSADPEYRPVRVAGVAKPLTHGDCREARRLAVEKPDLDVDRIPAPLGMNPPALAKVPPGVVGAIGAVIKADVIIDTLGRADMRTFKIIATSHPWLSAHVKRVVAKWRFTPAELAGCKVARIYHFSATAPAIKKTH
ncbi:MAG: hypothetical protein ABR499_22600 [Gemmatimonadaceae bacterium]